MTSQAIYYNQTKLEKQGAIERILGAINPLLFKRGPRVAVLDTVAMATKEAVSNKNDGIVCIKDPIFNEDSPSGNETRTPSKAAFEARVSLIRAHLNGRSIFGVPIVGDLAAMSILGKDGTTRVTLFNKKGYKTKSRVHWQGKVMLDRCQVTIEYAESAEEQHLYV